MSAKYLIFGATGSIGSNLANKLYDSSHDFHLVSRNEKELKSLSEKLKLEIYRDGKKYYIEFQNGKAKAPLKVAGKAKNTGTKITFLPSKEIFSSIKFSANILIKRMRELAFLNKGIKIIFTDSSQKKEKT